MTSATLQKRGKYWQSRLRLTNWDVEFSFKSAMDLDGAVGRCNFNLNAHHAFVNICPPQENTDPLPPNQDIDVTLVHELLHLYLTPLFDGVKGATAFEESHREFAIDAIAQAIVAGEVK